MNELIQKRTINSKTFHLGGDKYRLRLSQTPMHYSDGEKLQDIDLAPTMDRGQALINKAPFSLRVMPDAPAYRYTSKTGAVVEVDLAEINGNPIGARASERDGNSFLWRSLSLDTDYKIVPLKTGCSTILVLQSANAPRRWKWRVAGDASLLRPVVGHDAKGRRLEINVTVGADFIEAEWTGKTTSRVLLRTKRASTWTDDVAYPVTIDPTVNEAITNGADDLFSQWLRGGPYGTPGSYFGASATATELFAGRISFGGGAHQALFAGLRFRSVAIPTGATVDSAVLTVSVLGVAEANLTIFGADVDDAALWGAGNRVLNITKTSASAALAPSAGGAFTVDLQSIVQEIVSRGGWVSANDLALGIFPPAGPPSVSETYANIAALEHTTSAEAQLDIDYTVGGATHRMFLAF